MKVYVNGILFDSTKELIALAFDDDDQRRLVAGHLHGMRDRDDNKLRVYASYPGKISSDEFDELCNKIDHLDEKQNKPSTHVS